MVSLVIFVSYVFIFFIIWLIFFRDYIIGFLIRNQVFNCTHCGHCCRLRVVLTEDDIKKMKKVTKINFVENKKEKNLLKQVNGYCPFSSIDKGISTCTIYNNRPSVCRRFPDIKCFGVPGKDSRCTAFSKPTFLRYF